MTPITIDIVSDTVCPWCFVGKRRMEQAIAALKASDPDQTVTVRWHPFQLDPTVPPEGADMRGHLARKYGAERATQMKAALAEAGAELGIPFAFDKVTRRANTLDSHRLIRWAQTTEHGDAVVEGLFKAYFVEGRDIGNRDVLATVAGAAGLDVTAIRARLDTDEDRTTIEAEIHTARTGGVTGVPDFVVGRRFRLPGAQDSAYFTRAFGLLRDAGSSVHE